MYPKSNDWQIYLSEYFSGFSVGTVYASDTAEGNLQHCHLKHEGDGSQLALLALLFAGGGRGEGGFLDGSPSLSILRESHGSI